MNRSDIICKYQYVLYDLSKDFCGIDKNMG